MDSLLDLFPKIFVLNFFKYNKVRPRRTSYLCLEGSKTTNRQFYTSQDTTVDERVISTSKTYECDIYVVSGYFTTFLYAAIQLSCCLKKYKIMVLISINFYVHISTIDSLIGSVSLEKSLVLY